MSDAGTLRALRARSTSPSGGRATPPSSSSSEYDGTARPRRDRRLRAPPRPGPRRPKRRRASSPCSAARSATSRPAPGGALLREIGALLGPDGPAAARHRPGQGPGRDRGRLRRPAGRHGGVQPQRAARDQPRARRRLRPRRVRPRRLLRPPPRVDRDAPARAAPVQRADRPSSTCASSSPPARSCAPRSARSSRAARLEADFAAAGLALDRWFTDPHDLFALSLARSASTVGFSPCRSAAAGALVAGGASGLGEATARRLHADGAHVVIADLNEERGEALAAELGRARGVRAHRRHRCRRGAGRRRRRRRGSPAVCASPSAAPGSAGPRRSRASAGPHQLAAVRDGAPRQPDRHLQRAAPRGGGDARATTQRARASAACASTRRRSPPTTARSARSPTRRRRAAIVGMTLPAARDLASVGIRVCTIAPGIFDTPLLGALPGDRHARRSAPPCRSRPVSAAPRSSPRWPSHIVENEMLNGEVIRLDGALCACRRGSARVGTGRAGQGGLASGGGSMTARRPAIQFTPGVLVSPCTTIEQKTTSAARSKIRGAAGICRPRMRIA